MLILSLLISFGLYRISVTLLFNSKLSDYLLILFVYMQKVLCTRHFLSTYAFIFW